jgi:hypothetical protein
MARFLAVHLFANIAIALARANEMEAIHPLV